MPVDDILKKFKTLTPLERLRLKLERKVEESKIVHAISNKAASIQQIISRNEEVLERTKHKPIYSKIGNQTIYFKREVDDDFLFRKTRSTSINAAALEKCDIVVINIAHRGVKIMATKDEIKAYKEVRTYRNTTGENEVKYYYPIGKWEIIQGDMNWVEKVITDFNTPMPT